MKFCDKLSKLRKANNMSQEQLAERLEMSRQAISKWESGSSYPDMGTIMQLCKILNCSLDELVDDDATGNTDNIKSNKFNINNWLKEILDFITKTYNMFCSMTFKQKIKCIFEVFLIGLVIFIIGSLISVLGRELLNSLFRMLPYEAYNVIIGICEFIYTLLFIILGFIVGIHLFKIRYLDYFVTVEDKNVTEKTIEKPIDENNNTEKKGNVILEKPKEKIVIRDPQHTTYSFLNGLGKIVLLIVKIFLLFFVMPFVALFVAGVIGIVISIFLLQYGLIFLGVLIAILGGLIITYLFIEASFRILFNLKHSFKRIFILFIIGLVLVGSGIGLSMMEFSKFKIEPATDNIETKTEEIEINENTTIAFLYKRNVELIEDESLKNIKIEFDNTRYLEYKIHSYNRKIYSKENDDSKNKVFKVYELDYYYLDNYSDFLKYKDDILNEIKNYKIIDYDRNSQIKIYGSEANLKILTDNYDLLFR